MASRSRLEAVARTVDGHTVIHLQGEIDGAGRDALTAAYEECEPGAAVLLDFAGVDYINSTGIALIVGLLARARAESRPVSGSGLSDHYREIFEITRLSDFMTILAEEPPLPNDEHGAIA